ncbi:MAG: neutral/alkaline non-lysosomal ceramidase N-terminal domain-containing protein [Pirellulales bacterium]|nr:neutral/alkaline non-lysosomal ceramidase N-terminal domain-containing protein [Pirellulales bacterium]
MHRFSLFRPLLRVSLALVAFSLIPAVTGPAAANAADKNTFAVGVAERDITPEGRLPMWGYAARHDALSEGTLDKLMAVALVIHAGDDKLAIVGTDIGRGPTPWMMEEIRNTLREKAGIEHVIISGSHSHHGPVIELTDRPGYGQGKYDDAVQYAKKLPQLLIDAILEADKNAKPARMGLAKQKLDYNRNRHTKREPKVTDPELAVLRFDDLDGQPIALLVNFAAHPVMTDDKLLKFSADYPGFMKRKVSGAMSVPVVFMQGAGGDMSPNPVDGRGGPENFGHALADRVLELAGSASTSVPEKPSVDGRVDHFHFGSRVNFKNPLITGVFSRAFFPELVKNFMEEYGDGLKPEMNTIVLNGNLAIVSGSGEFFSNHSNRLKERSYLDHTLFFGYANGHQLYFPTIEAASEGGYGADPTMSPVQLGAGEEMMNRALVNIYIMTGRFAPAATGLKDVK